MPDRPADAAAVRSACKTAGGITMAGGGCDDTSLEGRVVVLVRHGFRGLASARDNGADASDTEMLLMEMAAPQKERTGLVMNAAAGAVVTLDCEPPDAMAFLRRLAESESTSAVTLLDRDGGRPAIPLLVLPMALDRTERTCTAAPVERDGADPTGVEITSSCATPDMSDVCSAAEAFALVVESDERAPITCVEAAVLSILPPD